MKFGPHGPKIHWLFDDFIIVFNLSKNQKMTVNEKDSKIKHQNINYYTNDGIHILLLGQLVQQIFHGYLSCNFKKIYLTRQVSITKSGIEI